MTQDKIIKQFIDLKNSQNRRFVELLEDSVSFTAKEKLFMIIDFYKYSDKQKEKLVKVFENDYRHIRNLKEKYPDDYQVRKKRTKKTWAFMMERLEEYVGDLAKKQKKIMDFEEIQKLKSKFDL
ncbi:hypothetical protein HQ571_06285 [Candidatus Kuenenbacteria bacterium]|nr:hypothetical protein [Candidatus Kuenenbacteria bacterium]